MDTDSEPIIDPRTVVKPEDVALDMRDYEDSPHRSGDLIRPVSESDSYPSTRHDIVLGNRDRTIAALRDEVAALHAERKSLKAQVAEDHRTTADLRAALKESQHANTEWARECDALRAERDAMVRGEQAADAEITGLRAMLHDRREKLGRADWLLTQLYDHWRGELCIHPERPEYSGGCWGLLPDDTDGWLREPCSWCRYERERMEAEPHG